MNSPQHNRPPSLGSTIFLGGGSIAIGAVQLAIGWRDFPAVGDVNPSSAYLAAIASGLLFVIVGLTVLVRDFAGARNKGELPANAPAFLRLSASLLNILLLAAIATVASVIALGVLPGVEQQFGGFGIFFRLLIGAFALLLWYGAGYLAISLLRRSGS